jgi:SAM-dependent methyltransferase
VATDTIDAVFLPHLLETTEDPHAVLREVDRILRPDGHVVIAGFNAWGWWGVRHYLSRRRFPHGGQRMVSEYRLRDWLNLLDYAVQPARFYHVAAPLYRSRGPSGNAVSEGEAASRQRRASPDMHYRWNPLASCYLLVARKEVFTLTPVRPAFRRRAQLVGGLVNPTTRNVA